MCGNGSPSVLDLRATSSSRATSIRRAFCDFLARSHHMWHEPILRIVQGATMLPWIAAVLLGALAPALVVAGLSANLMLLPLAFAVTLGHSVVLGLPAALFCRAKRWTRFSAAIVGALLIGAIPVGIFGWPMHPSWRTSASVDGVPTIIDGVPRLGRLGRIPQSGGRIWGSRCHRRGYVLVDAQILRPAHGLRCKIDQAPAWSIAHRHLARRRGRERVCGNRRASKHHEGSLVPQHVQGWTYIRIPEGSHRPRHRHR